jgi:hypothetical protein
MDLYPLSRHRDHIIEPHKRTVIIGEEMLQRSALGQIVLVCSLQNEKGVV